MRRERFVAVEGELVRAFGLGPAVVLQEIRFRTFDGTVDPKVSHADLADHLGLNRKQVQRIVSKLLDSGVLSAEARNAHRGDQTLTYDVDEKLVDDLVDAANRDRRNRLAQCPKTSTPERSFLGTDDCPETTNDQWSKTSTLLEEKKVEEEKKTTREPFEAEFDECWSIYPRKTNRKGSLRAFQARRREKVPAGDLLAATRAYGSSRVGEDPAFTMHGSTFFGPNERWVDWLAVYRANEAAGLLAPTPGSKPPVVLVRCGLCLGSTWWQDPEREGQPVDPDLDRCPVCEGTGQTEAKPTDDESEPF